MLRWEFKDKAEVGHRPSQAMIDAAEPNRTREGRVVALNSHGLREIADLWDELAEVHGPLQVPKFSDDFVTSVVATRSTASGLRLELKAPLLWLLSTHPSDFNFVLEIYDSAGKYVAAASSTSDPRSNILDSTKWAQFRTTTPIEPPRLSELLDRCVDAVAKNFCEVCRRPFESLRTHLTEAVKGQTPGGPKACAEANGYVLSPMDPKRVGKPSIASLVAKHNSDAAFTVEHTVNEWRSSKSGKKGKYIETKREVSLWRKYLHELVKTELGEKAVTVAATNFIRAMGTCSEVIGLFDETKAQSVSYSDVPVFTRYIEEELRAAGFRPKRLNAKKEKQDA